MQKRLEKIKQGMRFVLETKTKHPSARALQGTSMSLDEDHELEEFFDGLPGLFHGSMALHAKGTKPELERSVGPVAEKPLATCATGLLPRRGQETTSDRVLRSYLVLLQYHRSPFPCDLGPMDPANERPMRTALHRDMGSSCDVYG